MYMIFIADIQYKITGTVSFRLSVFVNSSSGDVKVPLSANHIIMTIVCLYE